MKSLPTSRSRVLLAAAVLLGVGFAYGFVTAKKRLFPHALIGSIMSGKDTPGSEGIKTVMPSGWWVEQSSTRPSESDVTRDLEKLGYVQSYGEAGDEFGVVVHDTHRTEDGWNLIVSAHKPSVILADMQGEAVHEWQFAFDDIPKPEGYTIGGTFGTRYFRRAALLPDGDLLAIYDRSALVKLDRDSNLVWSLLGGYHHDLDFGTDGSIWTLTNTIHVLPRIHTTVAVFEDFITHVSADGEVLGQTSVLEAFENSSYASYLANLDPEQHADLFHTNTITMFDGSLAHHSPLFAEGFALVSIWGLDVVAIIDVEKVEVVWALSGRWHRQHEPIILENGNMLVFDNMGNDERSTVIEIEPFTQRVVWSYAGDESNDFYSALCGSSQRLPNGNTLITESLSGRAFEVAPDGDVVWRYLSPFRVDTEGGKQGVAVLMEVVRLGNDLSLDWMK